MHLLAYLLLVAVCLGSVASLPALPVERPTRATPIWPIPEGEESATVEHQNHTSSPEPSVRIVRLGDLIVSDQEYRRLLDRLRQEAEQDIRTDPRNYVAEDVDAEEIMRMFADAGNTSTTSPTADLSTVQSAGHVIGSLDANSVQVNDPNPARTLDSEEPESSTEECAICLQALSESTSMRLECTHKFHADCIDQWAGYQIRTSCPICRHPSTYKASRVHFQY